MGWREPALRRRAGAAWAALAGGLAAPGLALGDGPGAGTPEAGIDWVAIGQPAELWVARTETTVGQFRRFVQATGWRTAAERRGGGEEYAGGWVQRPGWTWQQPYGRPALDAEPAVHLNFHEAQAFCRWAGGRLPTDAEWLRAGHTELRAAPPAPLRSGQRHAYPTGERPDGAQCLDDCGPAARQRGQAPAGLLDRGHGHARAGVTPAGVNGLHDMAANVWEWVDEPGQPAVGDAVSRVTRGGSWWYGAAQMHHAHRQSKPAGTAVVYIGFRCARDVR